MTTFLITFFAIAFLAWLYYQLQARIGLDHQRAREAIVEDNKRKYPDLYIRWLAWRITI